MQMFLGPQRYPDVSAEQRRSSEYVKLIRKLRWIGQEGEAHRVERALSRDSRRHRARSTARIALFD